MMYVNTIYVNNYSVGSKYGLYFYHDYKIDPLTTKKKVFLGYRQLHPARKFVYLLRFCFVVLLDFIM